MGVVVFHCGSRRGSESPGPRSDAKALLSILADVLRTVNPEDPRTFITYSEALTRLLILTSMCYRIDGLEN